jgi:hypothetical protein
MARRPGIPLEVTNRVHPIGVLSAGGASDTTQLGYSYQVTQMHAALAAEPMSRYPSRKSSAP